MMQIDSDKLLEWFSEYACRQGMTDDGSVMLHPDTLRDAIHSGELAAKSVRAKIRTPVDRNITSRHKPLYADPNDPDGPMIPVDPGRCAAEVSVNKKTWKNGGPQCSMRRTYGPERAYCGNHLRNYLRKQWERVEK